MQLGFVSSILPDLSLEEVLTFAARNDFSAIEIMCWPTGAPERRYAGVTHLDVARLTNTDVRRVRALTRRLGVSISALGYYPNPLAANESEAAIYLDHLGKAIVAAARLDVHRVNTFIGREPGRSLAENWACFDARWPALIHHAEAHGVRIGIENCPMYFTQDEWPAGKNLATSPCQWRELFRRQPSRALGLNYDPSHFIWQMMDCVEPLREFAERIFHVHAKDARLDRQRLNDVGILATPLEFHQPKLPGLGEVDWRRFFAVLSDIGYRGPVCVEVEDRAYEASLEMRQQALRQSRNYLRQFIAG